MLFQCEESIKGQISETIINFKEGSLGNMYLISFEMLPVYCCLNFAP